MKANSRLGSLCNAHRGEFEAHEKLLDRQASAVPSCFFSLPYRSSKIWQRCNPLGYAVLQNTGLENTGLKNTALRWKDPQQPTLRHRFALLVQVLLLIVIGLSTGCTTTRYLSMRSVRENALASSLGLGGKEGPGISARTLHTLRRFALEDRYKADPSQCFAHIRQTGHVSTTSETMFSVSLDMPAASKSARKRLAGA